ncbi:MAG TPA: hypothetical protein VMH81_34380 [Bryobacteraceae bacterium]|nr:hypothetical protein [Bryobacteraceae bacterium]
MTPVQVESVANAVLYEGYLLYPYRSSAVKNRQRFNFGIVYPCAHSETSGGIDPWEMETQCLAVGGPLASLAVKVRFLRLVERTVGSVSEPLPGLPPGAEPPYHPSAAIEIDGRTYESWQEASECDLGLPAACFAELAAQRIPRQFVLPATRSVELLRNSSGLVAGIIVRTQEALDCRIVTSVEEVQDGLYRTCVRISNLTGMSAAEPPSRDSVLAQSLLSAHTILRVKGGEFISLLDPPPRFAEAANACRNSGTWPVLAGEAETRDTVLSSPIILYDYPQIAPESPGDLFDGAEIDEILSLRILTLTDEEKSAMRRSDERARRILERTESLPPEHFMKLHGVLRGLDPSGKEGS